PNAPRTYEQVARAAAQDPEAFWLGAARAVDWATPPTRALDSSRAPIHPWFPAGALNACRHALARPGEAGRGHQAAPPHDSPVTGTMRTYTYAALLDEVSRCARVLADRGVGRGDRVIIYMPMVPEAVVAMLACARLGAIHSVVFGGFAAAELAARIDDMDPIAVISASCGVERTRIVQYKPPLDEALRLATAQPRFSVVVQREQDPVELREGFDRAYATLLAEPPAGIDPVTVAATDPLYVL